MPGPTEVRYDVTREGQQFVFLGGSNGNITLHIVLNRLDHLRKQRYGDELYQSLYAGSAFALIVRPHVKLTTQPPRGARRTGIHRSLAVALRLLGQPGVNVIRQ
jgi:hypothetical protein